MTQVRKIHDKPQIFVFFVIPKTKGKIRSEIYELILKTHKNDKHTYF